MLKSLIAFLQNLDKWSSKRSKLAQNMSNLMYPFYAFLIWAAYLFILDEIMNRSDAINGLWFLILAVFVTTGVGIASYLSERKANYLFNLGVLPVLIGSLFYYGVEDTSLWYDFQWDTMIGTTIYLLAAAYVLIGSLQYFFPDAKIPLHLFRHLAAAFWLISGVWLILVVSVIVYLGLMEFIDEFFAYHTDWSERSLMVALIVSPFMFYAAFSRLALEYKITRSTVAIAFAGIAAFTMGSGAIVKGYSEVMQWQLAKANRILSEEGENATGFSKARGVFLLDSAIFYDFKAYRDQNTELVAKLYDDTFANVFGDRLDEEDIPESRTSWGTNAFEREENASVGLDFAEYETNLISEISLAETTVTYIFQNTTRNQQEVMLEFDLPSAGSVITDLKLGLNLELQGQVAPRGAAEKVYQDSLRRRTDPALISKTGVHSYRLRVFPIQSNTDKKTQGRQKVQFTYLTPITADASEIVIAPRLNTLNLRLQDKTQISAKLLREGKILEQKTLSGEQQEFFRQNQLAAFENNLEAKNWCFANESLEVISSQQLNAPAKEPPQGVSIFFDISASAADSSEIQDYYRSVQETFSDQNLKLYTYNFDVYQVATLDNLEFWGYTDSSRVISYLDANKIQNQHVILVTDGHSFERSLSNASLSENKNINFAQLATNTFSIIEVGQEPKAYRDEIVKLLLATGGDIYKGSQAVDLMKVKTAVLAENANSVVTPDCDDLENEELLAKWQKLQAHRLGKNLFAGVSGIEDDWENVAQEQSDLAYKFQIVNFYNSMIALETERQQRDLEQYKGLDNRYDNNYQNFDKQVSQNRSRRNPEVSFDGFLPGSIDSVSSDSTWATSGGERGDFGLISESDRPENVSASSGVSFRHRDFGIFDVILIVLAISGLFFFFFRGKPEQENKTNDKQDQEKSE